MKFKVETLIDITETNARKGTSDIVEYNQQQNFLTVIQTIGLRVNLNLLNSPSYEMQTSKEFGTKYKGKLKIWSFEFEVEFQDALTIEMLENDFELVPVITGLTETAKIKDNVFRTIDATEKNILFKSEY